MDLDKRFATDEKVELEGKWETFEDDAEILIARVRNKNWRREARRLPRSIRRQMNDDVLPEGTLDEITAELMAKTVLLDWRNFTIEGKAVEYSFSTCKDVLIRYPDFRDRVFEMANDAELFRRQEMTDLGKDSETQSDGTS